MKGMTVLLIKWITAMIVFAISLDLFFDATFADILSFSLLVTAISYILGDRIILPLVGNRKSLAIDFFLVYTSVWIFGSVLLDNYLQIAWGSIISASLITAGEFFVHRYLLSQMETRKEKSRKAPGFNRHLAYGTEFAEEQEVSNHHKRKK